MSRLIPRKAYTLAIIRNETRILLGYKKRGFGKGKWNGFGGKIEDDETVISAALREVKEECGLELEDLTKVGTLEFEFLGKPEIMHVHVLHSTVYSGYVEESEEMLPKWFMIDNIPYEQMWPDDKHWLPLVLTGQKFHGYFLYDKEENILEKRLKLLDNVSMLPVQNENEEVDSHDPEDMESKLKDHDDLHILDFEPSLRTLCLAAVIHYQLDDTSLPEELKLELTTMKTNNRGIQRLPTPG